MTLEEWKRWGWIRETERRVSNRHYHCRRVSNRHHHGGISKSLISSSPYHLQQHIKMQHSKNEKMRRKYKILLEENVNEDISYNLFCYIEQQIGDSAAQDVKVSISFVFSSTLCRYKWHQHLQSEYYLDCTGNVRLMSKLSNNIIQMLMLANE